MNAVAQAIADTHDDIATLRAVTAEYLHGRLLTAIGHGADDGAVLASSVVDTLSASLLDALVDGQPAAQLLRDLQRTGLLSAAGEDTYRWPRAMSADMKTSPQAISGTPRWRS